PSSAKKNRIATPMRATTEKRFTYPIYYLAVPASCIAVLLLAAGTLLAAGPSIEFSRDVRPTLSDRRFSCHGPDRASRKSAWRLDQEESARTVVDRILPRITSTDLAKRMPPAYLGRERLPDAEIEILRRWIEEG